MEILRACTLWISTNEKVTWCRCWCRPLPRLLHIFMDFQVLGPAAGASRKQGTEAASVIISGTFLLLAGQIWG